MFWFGANLKSYYTEYIYIANDLAPMFLQRSHQPFSLATIHSDQIMPPITGHSVLIIGGTSGIGFAVAQLAASQGAKLVSVASSNPDRVAAAVSRIEAAAPGVKVSGHASRSGESRRC